MNKEIIFLFFIVLVINLCSNNFEILSSNNVKTEILFTLDEYSIISVSRNNYLYDTIVAEGAANSSKRGFPDLPHFSTDLIIPDFDKIEFDIATKDYDIAKVNTILPSFGKQYSAETSQDIFSENKIYKKNIWYSDSLVIIDEPFIFRDVRGINLQINPFVYNSRLNKLKIYKKIRITLRSTGISKKNKLTIKHDNIPLPFYQMYQNNFLNFRQNKMRLSEVKNTGEMLIITKAVFFDKTNEFALMKNKKGIKTRIVIYPDDTGSGWESIKNFIRAQYEISDLTYLLLIGDSELIPSGTGDIGNSNAISTDFGYNFLAGEDNYPDIITGRFAVHNLENLKTVINKNISFEINPNLDPLWYKNAMLISCPELSDELCSQKFDIIEDNLLKTGFLKVDNIRVTKGLLEIDDYINKGKNWIFQYGNGHVNSDIRLNYEQIIAEKLTNIAKFPIIISLTNKTDRSDRQMDLASAWQNSSSDEQATGSIFFCECGGMQSGTGLQFMNYISQNIMRYHDIGSLLFDAGIKSIIDDYQAGSELFQMSRFYGDPSLAIYSEVPKGMIVSYRDFITLNDSDFNIYVSDDDGGISNALVAFSIEGELIESSFTDSYGNAVISLPEPLEQANYGEISITAANKIPFLGTIQFTKSNEEIEELQIFDIVSYPNPFYTNSNAKNQKTHLDYKLNVPAEVKISIHNSLGQNILSLIDNFQKAGSYSFNWDGKDKFGRDVSSGIYFYFIEVNQKTICKKMMIMK